MRCGPELVDGSPHPLPHPSAILTMVQSADFPAVDSYTLRGSTVFVVACLAGGLATLYLHFNNPQLLSAYCVEDGPVETLQAAIYLACSAAFLLASRKSRGAARFVQLALVVLTFLAAGEEISWGQRIFGFATPSLWARLNVQNETNIHNLVGIVEVYRMVGTAVSAMLFIVLPLLASFSQTLRERLSFEGLPAYPAAATAVPLSAMLMLALPRLIWSPISQFGHLIFNFDEVGELYLAATFLVLGLRHHRDKSVA